MAGERIVQCAWVSVAVFAVVCLLDIVIDAFRVESLDENEQAAGMASYVAAYRIGMLVSTAGVLFLVTAFESSGIGRTSAWMWGYVAMAAMVLLGAGAHRLSERFLRILGDVLAVAMGALGVWLILRGIAG